ncbi:hypothetical protein GHT06_016484 [Daphnia sinensis]|uniref:Apple domain-containing protein n=1 Tax=Daphnia sinensis TaxID=1820382 RepID=A0AAD5PT10_9CRUS|nr:hypothetical protein GHT06_016484 [Daphnia sinensis]
MALIHPCLLILAALPVTISDTSKWDGFLTGKGGYKWLPNCEFAGFDIGHKSIEQEKCGPICLATSHSKGCNAFSWQSGWCHLKLIPAHSLSLKPTTGGSCGFLPWEFEDKEIFEDVEDITGIEWEDNGDTWVSGPEEVIEDITVQAKQIKCAYIKNLAFDEYLFAADHTYDENSRPVFTWRSKREGHPRNWSSTQGLWILEEEDNELLFASDCRFAQYERQVFTWRNPTRYDHGHLHWQLEDAMDNTFYIKNRMFGEYLYAVEDALSFDPVRRQVHTWTQSRDVSAWAGVGNWVVETTTCPK